jgi:hypothetical protein
VACRGLDAQVVRPEDPELTRLLNQFVPVRITNFRPVDMNRYRFDYDLTFAVLMMNAEGQTYARFGTRDAQSETDRMSIAGLKRTMRAVLARHRSRPSSSSGSAASPNRFTLEDIPSFRQKAPAKNECAHCHFANNFRFAQLRAEGRFSKDLLFQYPLPENIGLTLDVDANNVVRKVRPGSPAAHAGVQPGDTLVRAGTTPVLTCADLQFALNSIPDNGTVTLHYERGGKGQPPAVLHLPRGWRRTDISWRASQDSIPPTVGFWGEPLSDDDRKQRGIPADGLALKVTFLFPGPEWERTRGGLQKDDVVVGVNNDPLRPMTTRQFHSYFRLAFNVGDTVILNVRRGSERVSLRVPCIEVKEG